MGCPKVLVLLGEEHVRYWAVTIQTEAPCDNRLASQKRHETATQGVATYFYSTGKFCSWGRLNKHVPVASSELQLYEELTEEKALSCM